MLLNVTAIALLLFLSVVSHSNSISVGKSALSNHVNSFGLENSKHITKISDGIVNSGSVIIASSGNDSHHKISVLSLIINIVADLCPHGMLPLAYGLAQGGPTGTIPALLLIVMFGTMSGYTMYSFAALSQDTNSKNIAEIWSKLFSPKTKWIVDVSIFALCFGCCVFYSAFVGDIFSALASAARLPSYLTTRWIVLVALSTIVLLPLCLLDDLSALQFSSKIGVAGILITLFYHILRAIDGKYSPGSALLSTMSLRHQPHWPTPKSKFSIWNVNTGTLILVNMLCVAFLAHYNAISYFEELENKSLPRYKKALTFGFGTAVIVFASMAFAGYSIFGTASQPLILNNFHATKDILGTVARLGTGLAITFAYPLMFAGLKAALKSMLAPATTSTVENKGEIEEAKLSKSFNFTYKSIQIATLVIITSIACKCTEEDVSIVLGIVGSVLGCSVAYILPALLNLQNMRMKKKSGIKNAISSVVLNHTLLGLGVVFGVLGVLITMKNADSHGHGH